MRLKDKVALVTGAGQAMARALNVADWQQRIAQANTLPEVAAPAAVEQFLHSMRRGTPTPKIKVR